MHEPLTPWALPRRRFLQQACLALAPAPVWAVQPGPGDDPALEASDAWRRARALMARSPCVDIHGHVGGSGPARPVHDFPALQASGLSAACISLVSDKPVLGVTQGHIHARREPEAGELWQAMQARFDFADQAIREQGLRRITRAADLHETAPTSPVGLIIATEGADFLDGRAERLEPLHARGLRHLQLVHYRADNGIGDIQTEAPQQGGATPWGLELVRACQQLRIVVDVAHATLETVKQVARVSTAPLVLSHTALAAAPRPRSRSISAEHARVVADTGGVVGLWTSAGSFPTPAAFAQGAAALAEAIGVAHVAIGSDMNGLLHPLLSSYADFPQLVTALLAHFSEDETAQILGGNYLRVFAQVVG